MTAAGFVFLSLEDETRIANAVLTPQLFDSRRLLVSASPCLLVEGRLQNVQGVRMVRAERLAELALDVAPPAAHDFR
jgi:error-prone DNA polymerase